VRAADAYGGRIVYEAGGRLKELELATGTVRALSVTLPTDQPQTRPKWQDASENVEDFALSPGGKRAVLTARGEVFTVPVKDGATRNLTQTDDRREYTALWSPKGDRIAYIVQRDTDQVARPARPGRARAGSARWRWATISIACSPGHRTARASPTPTTG